MQPTLVLTATHPGILYINGTFAGEISTDAPLMRPIAGRGAIYLDYRPFTNHHLAMTRKLVFSGGSPLMESVEEAEGLNIILWPGSIVESEFSPQATHFSRQHFNLGGHNFILDEEKLQLSCDGRPLCTLPQGAQIPELHAAPSGILLIGNCSGGKYLLSTDSSLQNQTGFLIASQLDMESNGRIRAIVSSSDLVGHAMLESWQLTSEGLLLLSSEPTWFNGEPRWPQTPEETMRAAVEAALIGLETEAERYLSPMLRNRMPLSGIREKCDLCVELKYAPPSLRACVGMLHLEGEQFGRVSPLYFHASLTGDPQIPYQIDELEFI